MFAQEYWGAAHFKEEYWPPVQDTSGPRPVTGTVGGSASIGGAFFPDQNHTRKIALDDEKVILAVIRSFLEMING